jgi:hypothetical protein
MISNQQHPASFRDPAGFVFSHNGNIYRQVNQLYANQYELLKSSGLYDLLVKEQQLIAHTELNENITGTPGWYKTLLPQQLPFVSWPWEWSFSQWKDAALLTLDLVKQSVAHGMIIKDATPFNIQFVNGTPVFIDTLSFSVYDSASPWIAYRQFIECFLGPLLLARYVAPGMLAMFQLYPDGVPVRQIAKLLPLRARFNGTVFLHIILPGLLSGDQPGAGKKPAPFTQQKLLHIISNLHGFIGSLRLPPVVTQWNNYYESTILSGAYAEEKMAIVKQWLQQSGAATVLDAGTNTGLFALAAAAAGKYTIAVDADGDCIDTLYTTCRHQHIQNLLPLRLDITNPSPAIGWDNKERADFFSRVQVDCVMALALVHHLAIGKNIPLEHLAACFYRFAPSLIIEFVPKADPRVQLLLSNREDIFTTYTETGFLQAFGERFTVEQRIAIKGTERVLFLMKRK